MSNRKHPARYHQTRRLVQAGFYTQFGNAKYLAKTAEAPDHTGYFYNPNTYAGKLGWHHIITALINAAGNARRSGNIKYARDYLRAANTGRKYA
jgi:hypothetical protein